MWVGRNKYKLFLAVTFNPIIIVSDFMEEESEKRFIVADKVIIHEEYNASDVSVGALNSCNFFILLEFSSYSSPPSSPNHLRPHPEIFYLVSLVWPSDDEVLHQSLLDSDTEFS